MIIIRLKTGYGGGGGQRIRAFGAWRIAAIAGHVRKMGGIATAHIGGAGASEIRGGSMVGQGGSPPGAPVGAPSRCRPAFAKAPLYAGMAASRVRAVRFAHDTLYARYALRAPTTTAIENSNSYQHCESGGLNVWCVDSEGATFDKSGGLGCRRWFFRTGSSVRFPHGTLCARYAFGTARCTHDTLYARYAYIGVIFSSLPQRELFPSDTFSQLNGPNFGLRLTCSKLVCFLNGFDSCERFFSVCGGPPFGHPISAECFRTRRALTFRVYNRGLRETVGLSFQHLQRCV